MNFSEQEKYRLYNRKVKIRITAKEKRKRETDKDEDTEQWGHQASRSAELSIHRHKHT